MNDNVIIDQKGIHTTTAAIKKGELVLHLGSTIGLAARDLETGKVLDVSQWWTKDVIRGDAGLSPAE